MAWLSSYLAHGTTLKYVPEQDQEVAAKVIRTMAKVEPKGKAKPKANSSKAIPKASAMKAMKSTIKAKK